MTLPLQDWERGKIIDTYKELKSIKKTAETTGYSYNAVNKYVKHLSSLDKRSRYRKNFIQQIDLNIGKIIKVWDKPTYAAKELNINLAEIVRVAKGELKQAGGYGWKYIK